MKTLLLTLVAILGIGATNGSAAAREPVTFKPKIFKPKAFKSETIVLRNGTHRTAARGELTIKFVTVLEDSRCPVGVNCVWAGNAKIQLRVADRQGHIKMLELNTNGDPNVGQFGGYAISLVNLTPKPTQNRHTASRYNAKLSIQRITR